MSRWIHFQPPLCDLLTTFDTMTKTILIQVAQGATNAIDLRFPLPVCRERDLLVLHGIDSRESTDTLLIERDRGAITDT